MLTVKQLLSIKKKSIKLWLFTNNIYFNPIILFVIINHGFVIFFIHTQIEISLFEYR